MITGFSPGVSTKVVIHPDPDLGRAVRLRGMDCATDQPLRSCCHDDLSGLVGHILSPSAPSQRGVTVRTIEGCGHAGHTLFPRTGYFGFERQLPLFELVEGSA